MLHIANRQSVLGRLIRHIRSLRDNRRGVAAIEFALIAPLLLCMYFVTMEVAPAIDTSKKVGRSASMIADLITQQPSVTKADLEAIMRIGNATLMPYTRTNLKVTVTAISITDSPLQASVVWSRKMENGAFSRPFNPGSTVTVPAQLMVPGTLLIRVATELGYQPMITWSADSKKSLGLMAAFDQLNMGKTYHLRPRIGSQITCSDC